MILLDYTDRRPIYEQVVERLQDLILKGILAKNSPLPSVRSLAMELSINPNTIQRAYAELERTGWIYSVKGKGSFVAAGNELLEGRKRDWHLRLGTMLDEAALLGIEKQEIVEQVLHHSEKRADGGEQFAFPKDGTAAGRAEAAGETLAEAREQAEGQRMKGGESV